MSSLLKKALPIIGVAITNPVETSYTCAGALRDFIVANSPIAYASEGRIVDLAVTVLVAEESESALPGRFELVGAYPNPFNSYVKIVYLAPESSKIAFRFYDVLGREVDCVEGQAPGHGFVLWDGRGIHGKPLGSGMYVCVAEFEGHREALKLILIE